MPAPTTKPIHAVPTFPIPGTGAHLTPKPEKDLHGGKGAGLLHMTAMGFNVPQAMIFTTEAWRYYRKFGKLSPGVETGIARIAGMFPDAMFSVRSGAPVSMPGMMDTILNVGSTPDMDDLRPGAFRRFALGWLEIVNGVHKDTTEAVMRAVKGRTPSFTKQAHLLAGILHKSGHHVPLDREAQLASCVEAVFRSWDTPRAIAYRKMHGIPETMGTGCIIQRMVMGNAPGLSGSGVMFSRDPATGIAAVTGEIAFNAQGEEVVNGSVTPMNISELGKSANPDHVSLLNELGTLASLLEGAMGDVQDIEFTVEAGTLYVLQTRTAKMSARARVLSAADLAAHKETPEASLKFLRERVSKGLVAATMVPTVVSDKPPVAIGLAASPGAISGPVVFRSTPLKQITKGSILLAADTAPEDFPQMAASGGILTATGGFTCHSAVVARGIGVPAVVGCSDITVNPHKKTAQIGGHLVQEGTMVTIDGATGKVWVGSFTVKVNQPPRAIYETLFNLAQKTVPDAGNIWWNDVAIGPRVCLPLPLGDMARCEAQITRALSLEEKGKQVTFRFQMIAPDEDLVPVQPAAVFAELGHHFKPDLKGMTFVPDMPPPFNRAASTGLGMKPLMGENGVVQFGDLLDLLGTAQ